MLCIICIVFSTHFCRYQTIIFHASLKYMALHFLIHTIPSSLLFHIKDFSMWAADGFDIYPEIAEIKLCTARCPAFYSTARMTAIFQDPVIAGIYFELHAICSSSNPQNRIWSMSIFPVSLICMHSIQSYGEFYET